MTKSHMTKEQKTIVKLAKTYCKKQGIPFEVVTLDLSKRRDRIIWDAMTENNKSEK